LVWTAAALASDASTVPPPKCAQAPKRKTLREVVLAKSVSLFVGGFVVGWINGPERMADINKVFLDLFKGVLAFCMIGTDAAAAKRLGELVASLGITFPYNVLLGIPLYQKFATWLGAG